MYNKHNWSTGEIITSDKINNIEQGIASSVSYIYEITDDLIEFFEENLNCIKLTYNQLYSILQSGKIIKFNLSSDENWRFVYLHYNHDYDYELYSLCIARSKYDGYIYWDYRTLTSEDPDDYFYYSLG